MDLAAAHNKTYTEAPVYLRLIPVHVGSTRPRGVQTGKTERTSKRIYLGGKTRRDFSTNLFATAPPKKIAFVVDSDVEKFVSGKFPIPARRFAKSSINKNAIKDTREVMGLVIFS
ncbi:unnamed protein product, partial [Amoebophrya sp. A120]|eukprot:GSA120T00020995001.1